MTFLLATLKAARGSWQDPQNGHVESYYLGLPKARILAVDG